MDLSFESWDYKIPAVEFSSETELAKFVGDCQPYMEQIAASHDHDRFTYFVKFYREFKSQNASLLDFFAGYDKRDYPTDERRDCVGRTLKLKGILGRAFPAFKDKFYISSCAIDYEDFNKKLTGYMVDEFHYLVNFSERCVLTLKFELDGRTGFVLYEMSFLNDKPIVVMTDNQSPGDTSVTFPKGIKATYDCLTSDHYIEVFFDEEDGSSTTKDVFTMVIFVGGSFKRLDILAKYSFLVNIQYAYIIREGRLLVDFSRYGKESIYNIRRWDDVEKDYVIWEVPTDYFLKNEPNEEFETEFEKLAKVVGFEENDLRNCFADVSKIQLDLEFLTEMSELPLAVKKAKENYVTSVSKNIRNKFYDVEYYIATRARKFQDRIHTPIQYII